jgi:hypothetical protein
MSEMELIVDHLRLTYEGLFKVADLYNLMDEWFKTNGYDKRELKSIERIAPEGKYIEIEWMPWKKQTEYLKNDIKIRMLITNITEVEVKRKGTKVKMDKGKVKLVFDGYLTTDYEKRWEEKPMLVFIRAIFDKYLYKNYMDKWKKNLIEDINDLHDKIRGMLNLHRYKYN